MLSEEFDKKMREAADRHHPQYDERAWREMKKLLDQHMPVEEDRKRRGLFFLLFLLLLGGGAAFYFLSNSDAGSKEQFTVKVQPVADPHQPVPVAEATTTAREQVNERSLEKPVSAAEQTQNAVSVQPVSEKSSTRTQPLNKRSNNVPSTHSNKEVSTLVTGNVNAVGSGKKTRNIQVADPALPNTADNAKVSAVKKKTKSSDNNQPTVTTGGSKSPQAEPASLPVVTASAAATAIPAAQGKDNAVNRQDQDVPVNTPVANAAAVSPAAAPAVQVQTETKTNPIKQVSKKKSSFFIAASAAPDVSFTSGDELGRLKLTGGFGLGYTYRGRLSLRTGFYTVRKIYTASPDNYKRTAWFNQYYPNLQKVEADCEVQEIPVLLTYHFGQQGRHQWLASAGVSTLIMKEETYDYYYKYTPWGQVVNRSYSTYNQNKHPFSIMTLSAGYQYKMGKRFSVMAEPYLKLPLSGVGIGKVRLNSMGVMFSVTASPFGK